MKYLFITVNICDNTIGFGIIYILHIIEGPVTYSSLIKFVITQTIHYVTFMNYIKMLQYFLCTCINIDC